MGKNPHNVPGVWPYPHLIVSVRDKEGNDNALAIGFGVNCSFKPPMVMIGVKPSRFSWHMIKENPCFVINYPQNSMKKEFGYLGTHSGRDGNKLKTLGLKTRDAACVNAPILAACPASMECRVIESTKPGSHELFVAEVLAVNCDEKYLDEHGEIQWDKMDLILNFSLEGIKSKIL